MSKWVQRASAVFRLDLLEESGSGKGAGTCLEPGGRSGKSVAIEIEAEGPKQETQTRLKKQQVATTRNGTEQFQRIAGGDLLGEDEKHLLPKLPAAMVVSANNTNQKEEPASMLQGLGFGARACLLLALMVLLLIIERIFY
eukprot:g5445.t1